MYCEIEKKLSFLEHSIKTNEIELDSSKPPEVVVAILWFEVKGYFELIQAVHKKRRKCVSIEEKLNLNSIYLKIEQSNLKIYKTMLKNIESGSFIIKWKNGNLNDLAIIKAFESYFEKQIEGDISDVIFYYLKRTLIRKITEVNCEIYCLKKHPYEYANTLYTYIGPYKINRYKNDRVFYRDCSIISLDSHSCSISYNEKTEESTKNAIVDILSYFNAQPYFLFTQNPSFNRKLCELYEQFDFLDIIKIRDKKYFKADYEEKPTAIVMPILKARYNTDIVEIPSTSHEKIFSLYHASLKQFEPLPRCVFLYRVFEYGAKYHYQKIFRPSNYNVQDAIDYYVSQIFSHNYIPLYYIEYGKAELDRDNSVVNIKKKSICHDFLALLKKEALKILTEWQRHPYLKNKSIGEIVYETGRNAAAHASGGRIDARYDYSNNYKHINDVNIILELVARYIIEELHPEYGKLVCKNRSLYIKQSLFGF